MYPKKRTKACSIEASTVQVRNDTVRMVQACAECTERCLSIHIHKKENQNSIIHSFFKVMIGDHFSEFLPIPPKFAKTMPAVVGQKIELRDCSERRWVLEFACIGGSLAFQQGWSDFSMDHGLELGDFVVFDCISASHFGARIYKRSGCEKLDFLEEAIDNKKRKVSSSNVVSGSYHADAKKSSTDNQASNTSVLMGSTLETNQSHLINNNNNVKNVPTATSVNRRNAKKLSHSKGKHMEEPCLLVDRAIEYMVEDSRTLFDLWDFEKGKRSTKDNVHCDTNEDKKFIDSKSFPMGNAHQALDCVLKDTVAGGEVNPCASLTEFVSGISEKCSEFKAINNTNTSEQNMKKAEERSELKVVKSELDVVEEEEEDGTEFTKSPYLEEALFSCVVTEKYLLEMPVSVRSVIPKVKKKMGKAVVYLRDVEGRVWPVMYQERASVRVLMSGWYYFREANHIEIGDECIFVLSSSSPLRDVFNIFVRSKAMRNDTSPTPPCLT